jgi:outer membrane immunogenic protein
MHLRHVSLLLFGLLGAAPAAAADLNQRSNTTPNMAAAIYNWTGWYVGADAGFAWGHASLSDRNGFNPNGSFSYNPTGGVFNLNTEYNIQYGMAVIGLGVELGDLGISGNQQLASLAGAPGDSIDQTRTDFYGAVTARLGFTPIDRVLLYGKGGFAFANVRNSFTDTNPTSLANPRGPFLSTTSASNLNPGWTLGAGVEYAFTDRWVARLEYDHYDFGYQTTTGTNINGTYAFRHAINDDTLRLGVSYKLN